MRKRIFSVLISALLMLTATVSYASVPTLAPAFKEESEPVTLIVEVEGGSLLDGGRAFENYLGTENAVSAEKKIRSMQLDVLDEIEESVPASSSVGYIYTAVFNGFSIEAPKSSLDDIKALPGVKNVYIAKTRQIPELSASSAEEITSAGAFYESEYKGQGQAIAILDAGCDTSHEYFSLAPENPKYTMNDIDTILKTHTTNANVTSANQVYKNAKIPYAFNYSNHSSDTYCQNQSHGTHVAGIAAGNGGSYPNGDPLHGVAPEAQLLIFSIADESGSFTDDALLAAINDAVILGADTLNMSFSMPYQDPVADDLLYTVLENAQNAGVALFASAGNNAIGYDGKAPLTTNPDYSTAGTPQGYSFITAVASSDNKVLSTSGTPSYYTSWGVSASLELKPEIMAPGGSIYSSLPDNQYGYKSGTSMATPFMSGVGALVNQYYQTNPFKAAFNGYTGKEKASFLEKLMMTSAKPAYQANGVPFSPRQQGAGQVDMKNLLACPVVLTGDTGKAKLSLGEIEDTFTIEFDITNISNRTVTFDDISLQVTTDGYKTESGKNVVSGTVSFPVSASLPETVTIESGETYTLRAEVRLDEAEVLNQLSIFENGFFVDGYVILNEENDLSSASLPFTSFYGDWDNLKIFDTTVYENGGSTLIDEDVPFTSGTFIGAADGTYLFPAGRNYLDPTYVSEDLIAYSHKEPYVFGIFLKTLRAIDKGARITVENKDGETVFSDTTESATSKFTQFAYFFDKETFPDLPEGAYTFRMDAPSIGSTEVNDTLSIPFVVDNTDPEILSASLDKKNKTVTLTVSDNHAPDSVYIYYDLADGTRTLAYEPIYKSDASADGTTTKTVSIPDCADFSTIEISCMDYAKNDCVYPLRNYTSDLSVISESFTWLDGVVSANYTVKNNLGKSVTANVFLVFYAGEEFAGIATDTVTLDPTKEGEVNFTALFDKKTVTKAKVFLWEKDTFAPLNECLVYPKTTSK